MKRSKPLYFLYLAISFLAISLLLFIVFSRLIAYFKTADQVAGRFYALGQKAVNYRPVFQWDLDLAAGRQMEEQTLEKITDHYLSSYYYHNKLLAYGNKVGLKDHFTDRSRAKVLQAAADMSQEGQKTHSTTISHDLTLDFYSEDGTLVVFKDRVTSYFQLYQEDEFILSDYDTAQYDVMLLLEDNFWRVRHKIRSDILVEPGVKVKSPCIEVRGDQFVYDDKPFTSKGINYYPAKFPWDKFWVNFDLELLKKDFNIIRSAGFNTVRIFIPYEQFGGPDLNPTHLDNLERLLDTAQEYDLKVIVTLFDFFLGYQTENWTLADRHVEGITSRFKTHDAIFAWDVKNEPDLDFDTAGKNEVKEWLSFILKRIKGFDPNHLLTIGWSSPEFITELHEDVDYYSFHFYRDPTELVPYLEIDYDKPLLLEETGQHSYSAWFYPFRKTRKDQAQYLSEITGIIRTHNISYALWTLYDFKNIPDNVVGTLPWRKGIQENFGLIDKRNRRKKAFDLVKEFNLGYE